jgi:starch-binding outer membrane protein, SusD/RagB family
MIKMTKNIKVMLCLLVIGTLLGSCEDILEKFPDDQINSEIVFSSLKKADDILIGVYNEIAGTSYLGAGLYLRAAMKGTDFRAIKPSLNERNPLKIEYEYSETPLLNGNAFNLWSSCYKALNNLNILLANIDEVSGDDSERNRVKGEALALRAMIHFDLVRTFSYPWINGSGSAQGIPLAIQINEVPNLERGTVADVYAQVISDYKEAEGLLAPVDNPRFINETAVQALLARTYLYQEDWSNSLTYAQKVISTMGAGSLMNITDFSRDAFNSESIFELDLIHSNNTVGSSAISAQMTDDNGGQEDILATLSFKALLTEYADDPRGQFFQEDRETSDELSLAKFLDVAAEGSHNVVVIRLSEVFLIAAEAAARSNADGAGYLYELTQRRSASYTLSTQTGEALVDEIAVERRKELAVEGHGVYDYIRRGKDITRVAADHENISVDKITIASDHYQTIYPIPLQEINASGMTQTQGGY